MLARRPRHPNGLRAGVLLLPGSTISRSRIIRTMLAGSHMAVAALLPHATFDPELYYGDGDDNALYNIFATWPENYFSSLPKPHGNRGVDEP
ncbi:hypothetical protein Purlil1_6332 [Purpureocillium lilacinum]|uniref:Uncharacterized protein n=1 Tax=Purpureocillium lilacinum TaxID=33203 RepID=A0ABR0C0S9_PURLI|nr:hypothetical protein Purlil1_6332 [Purpureocillium lilacinum]